MGRTRHADYQEKYRKKILKNQKLKEEFILYVRNKAPHMYTDFLAEKAVMLVVLVSS